MEENERVKEWLSFCQRSFSKNTCIQYRCVIGQLLKHISANGNEISTIAVERFLDEKLQRGYSRKQFNCYLIAIRSFSAWKEKRYNIPSLVHKIPFISEDPPKQRCLTEEEYRLLLLNTKGMDRDIILFIGNTGIRKAEFAGLKYKDIPIDLKYIKIIGKGRKQRIVPLNDVSRAVLQNYPRLADGEYLQISQRYPGGEGASWMLRRIAKKIGIPRCGLHSLRHRFATRCIEKGMNIFKLSLILGHSSVLTTQGIYLHLTPQSLYGETDCLCGD
ncbi:MAG: tyrosine-type recombinase/integrase [Planctomycetes bacterium]|nr:tyrosine-type recombinase/integrase [Planctomycetota bacterium]MCH8120278.1 tyrosine-type recombinase/integrase [Planctomycetota bacterium]